MKMKVYYTEILQKIKSNLLRIQDIDYCFKDSIQVGSAYKMMGAEHIFRFVYIQVVKSIMI